MELRMKYLLGMASVLLLATGCSDVQEQSKQAEVPFYEKQKVEAVFYHHVNYYSVMVRNGEELTPVSFPRPGALDVRLIDDVQPDEDIWYEISYVMSERDYLLRDKKNPGYLNIHIRSLDDLKGASWNHGKNGRGTTIKIATN
jgi:hypothetical protein